MDHILIPIMRQSMVSGSEPPPTRKSTARVLLVGCAGLVAFGLAAFVVLVVVRAVQMGNAPAARDVPASEATIEPPPGAYRHPSGCYWLQIGDEWELVEETGLGSKHSADPANPLRDAPRPGEAGLWVEAACAPLDKVGTNWSPSVPGATVLERSSVDFGGGSGSLRTTLYHPRDLPETLEVRYSVDRRDARCSLTVDGGKEAVERFRPELERAAASFVCAGR